MKIKMNFIFPLRLKRRKVAQTASYGLFKKQWRQLARSKQLVQRAKVSDLAAWARSTNNLDVSWLAKKLVRSFNRAPIIFWWRKKPRRHMYWKLVKKRKPQKKLKVVRSARRLTTSRRLGRPMLLPRTGIFRICNPFNGRWARTPARWPFKKRRIVLQSGVKKAKSRGLLLNIQSTYLRWLQFFSQEYFWFRRQTNQPAILGSKFAMRSFACWATQSGVLPAGSLVDVVKSEPVAAVRSQSTAGRFHGLGLKRKIFWNYSKVTSAYWAGVRAVSAAPLGGIVVLSKKQGRGFTF